MQRPEIQTSSLSKMLTKDTIALGVRADDWQQAVREAGKLLVRSGAVERRYIDAMIQMVKDIGPYIVIAPGVALPHARPEDGVKRPCMSLVTLDPPVRFGNQHNDPVTLVVAFGTPDKEGHIEALAELARLLGDADVLARMKEASSPEELLLLVHGARAQRQPHPL